jgi:hypothetical protein
MLPRVTWARAAERGTVLLPAAASILLVLLEWPFIYLGFLVSLFASGFPAGVN